MSQIPNFAPIAALRAADINAGLTHNPDIQNAAACLDWMPMFGQEDQCLCLGPHTFRVHLHILPEDDEPPRAVIRLYQNGIFLRLWPCNAYYTHDRIRFELRAYIVSALQGRAAGFYWVARDRIERSGRNILGQEMVEVYLEHRELSHVLANHTGMTARVFERLDPHAATPGLTDLERVGTEPLCVLYVYPDRISSAQLSVPVPERLIQPTPPL